MPVRAYIDGHLCGETVVEALDGKLAYVLHVKNGHSASGSLSNCGSDGRFIEFRVGDYTVPTQRLWDNSQAQQYDLPSLALDLNLTLVNGSDRRLDWHYGYTDVTYEVHYSPTPHFTPITATRVATQPIHIMTYVDTENRSPLYYYTILVLNTDGSLKAKSNEVGTFIYTLSAD